MEKIPLKWMLIAFPSIGLVAASLSQALRRVSPQRGDTTDPLGIWWQLVAVLGGNPKHNVEEMARGLH